MNNNIKQLKKIFIGKGCLKDIIFFQVRASSKAYIYRLTDEETGKCWFEVFEKRIRKRHTRKIGNRKIVYPTKILYPNSEDFGKWAWCLNQLSKANKKFAEINKSK